MKRTSKLIVGGAILVAGLAIVYRAVNRTPDSLLPINEQMTEIMNDGGCVFCHTESPSLPFYANLPVAKKLIAAHVAESYKAFEITPMMDALARGEAVNEVDLAKVEKCVLDGSMPLTQY